MGYNLQVFGLTNTGIELPLLEGKPTAYFDEN
jgi:hypothetical protein